MKHELAKLIRLFETVRHLSAEQWYYRAVCRGRRVWMTRYPQRALRDIRSRAEKLPLANIDGAPLKAVAKHVLLLQQTVHDLTIEDVLEGRFRLLNRTVEFGSLDGVEWRRDLGEKNNPLWRMNLAYLGWLVPLLAEGDERALEIAQRIIHSLEEQNPFGTEGVFRDVWFPYAASHRCINLLSGLALFAERAGSVPSNVLDRLLQHIRFCAAFVAQNLERELQYNHLLKNYVALAVYASSAHSIRAFGDLPKGILRCIDSQILPDGGQSERAPMYHVLSILDLRILRDCSIWDAEGHRAIDRYTGRMERALAAMTLSDGEIARFNDSWSGEAPRPDQLIPRLQPGTVENLPDTGYVRIGTGLDSVVFDRGLCGPDDNPGHAHADFLSIEACFGGYRMIVDPGVPTYTAGSLRDESRSASRHNGPAVAGAEPIDFWMSFRVGRRGRAYPLDLDAIQGFAPIFEAGWHTGYSNLGITVSRCVAFWPGSGFLCCDLWMGGDASVRHSSFLIDVERWTEQGDRFISGDQAIHVACLCGSMIHRERKPYWPRFGTAKNALELRFAPKEVEENGFLTLWFGRSATPPVEVGVEQIANAMKVSLLQKH